MKIMYIEVDMCIIQHLFSQLFETQYVSKLLLMYKFTNPHTLFSDVVALLPMENHVKKCLWPMLKPKFQVAKIDTITVHTKV